MATFIYTGRDAKGAHVQGQQDAATSEDIASRLFSTGITPLEIYEKKNQQDSFQQLLKKFGFGRPKLTDLILFCRQMYALTKSGIPIVQGLSLLSTSAHNEIFAEALRSVTEDISTGRDLAGSFARHPNIFNSLFVNIIRVGEESGRLDEAFLRLFHYFDTDKVTLEKIKSVLLYPAIVVVAIIAAITFLMAKVIPKFAEVFRNFNLELPIQTRLIIAISEFVANYWWLLAIISIAAFIGIRNYVKTDVGRLKWHQNKLKIPRIGDIILRATLARFARAFAMTNTAGVPILTGLTVTARAVDNDFIESKIHNMRNDVERGDSLTHAAINTKLFTPLVIQMLSVGEETGRIDEMMDEVADFYEREVAYEVQNLTKIIEPILTVIMGLMVLVLALGIFLPLWDLMKIAQR
ncbi:MAG: type II secretion system F family protein [Gammaproteobacteria bacterium]|nr:type II secretion system F family protein [Gammaproteobacteria bacterium]